MTKITKTFLADQLGISRPTLLKYLKSGFPDDLVEEMGKIDTEKAKIDYEYEKLVLENEIRIHEYQMTKLKEQIKELEEEQNKNKGVV